MKKARKAKAKNEERVKKEKLSKEKYEELKQKAIQSGSAKDALKFKGNLTPQEMQYIENRLRWEKNMSDITSKEVSKGKARSDKFFNTVEDATKKVNTGIKAWNTFANIYNAFSGKDIDLPKISTKIEDGNKELRKKQKSDKAKKDAEAKTKEKAREESASNNSKEKVYTGTVEGEGTSRSSWNKRDRDRGKNYYEDVTNAEWRDVTPSNLPVAYRSAGESYVTALLEDKR